jgi:hypothetical protein
LTSFILTCFILWFHYSMLFLKKLALFFFIRLSQLYGMGCKFDRLIQVGSPIVAEVTCLLCYLRLTHVHLFCPFFYLILYFYIQLAENWTISFFCYWKGVFFPKLSWLIFFKIFLVYYWLSLYRLNLLDHIGTPFILSNFKPEWTSKSG